MDTGASTSNCVYSPSVLQKRRKEMTTDLKLDSVESSKMIVIIRGF